MMKTLSIVALVLVASSTMRAQTAEAILLPRENGFYRVPLVHAMAPFIDPRFGNVRVLDAAGKEVPYLLEEGLPSHTERRFRHHNILEKKIHKGCCTTLILENKDRRAITNISLLIKNADVTKQGVLSGSDDRVQWFAVKDKFTLTLSQAPQDTAELQALDFPLSNYRYYQLQLSDSSDLPLNILVAGYYETWSREGGYTVLPLRPFAQADSLKRTYVPLQFDSTRYVDRISLTVDGAPFYQRRAALLEETAFKKGGRTTRRVISTFILTSSQAAVFDLPKTKARRLLLVVENDDNPPLRFEKIELFQRDRYLVAWLQKDKTYRLVAGGAMQPPVYDMSFFKDAIPGTPAVLQPGPVRVTSVKELDRPTHFSRYAMWAALVVIIAVLGVMSVKLVRETNARDKA